MTTMIGRRVFTLLAIIGALLAVPVMGFAQEATLSGTVTDSTGGVLPGVTVTALHEATGNTFIAVTDQRGGFRLPVRTGAIRITMELSGFATATRTIELLLGQTAVVNLQMAPSTVQESVTVTGEAPLIDVSSSTVSGNIDPRQMQELPVNGRNWQDLVAAGAGKPRERGRRIAGPARHGRLSDQHGRPADHEQRGRQRLRQPALQPRRDRGVRVRREPLRRHAGAIERRAAERDQQVRHEHADGQLLGILQKRPLQRGGPRRQAGASLLGSAGEHDVRWTHPEGQDSLLPELRIRARAADLHLHDAATRGSISTRRASESNARRARGSISSSHRRCGSRCAATSGATRSRTIRATRAAATRRRPRP